MNKLKNETLCVKVISMMIKVGVVLRLLLNSNYNIYATQLYFFCNRSNLKHRLVLYEYSCLNKVQKLLKGE